MFINMKIKTKLFLSFGIVVLLTILLAGVSYWSFMKVGTQWTEFQEVTTKKNDAVAEGKAMLSSASDNFKNYLLRGGGYEMSFQADLGGIEFAASTYTQVGDLTENEKDALARITSGTEKYLSGMRKAVELKDSGSTPEQIDQQVQGIDEDIRYAFDDLTQITREKTTESGKIINELVNVGTKLILIFAGICIVLGIIFSKLTSKSISKPLEEAVKVAKTVSDGDLSSKIIIKSKNETGKLLSSLQEMNDSLINIVTHVRQSSDIISQTSNELSLGNLELSQRTEQQASSLEETASSMEELTSTVKQNANNAKQANQLATIASEVAFKGGTTIDNVVNTMTDINESAKKIVDIISVIDSIAFQTNILALNAAVEAARAGEQGRGFAVVASEVRNLAQRSANAAKEIKILIEESVQKVDTGSLLVEQAGITMKEIVGSVQKVKNIIEDISIASDEQAKGINQVNETVLQIDSATQQNAALVEEASAASISLKEQAEKLVSIVNFFKIETLDNADDYINGSNTF